ncbi:MAG TPA: L-2-amino-thiazoline-4-carboxylic acid hydrolase [Thermoanaerobaculales bacterium]|nr:L-2-amino-thiazoline-4-carboxylic acid hydrolase [Thermoanaerobaculales bacterium]HPA82100.1 L-2-amino-thiazoline-4-carboxylic acid hydrolase [Thermoanaerobaculales bacterium]HQL29678.1 L-2-amino-thiazoline-4-carboxylic acid hydrolase [Thermoanaerobaculales bacterium]HQN95412.1 L-2-amino-thiazoline-4-carboxylic acid hydrolase [Thermoanaerobaculales bacterium]HQP43621.1 L-2-amino-thiazoline-4-carboxylic acid hydrolase [Thermoanaerobaculales bacterium]
MVRASDSEVVLHIRACEWARYFRERHFSVGYLVACSTDDAELRAVTDNLRMQRTSTIMEGGTVCDFRVYKV